MNASIRYLGVLCCLAVFLLASTYSQASTYEWNNAGGGTWDTPGNWSPVAVPPAGSDVEINGLYLGYPYYMTITLDSPQSIGNLTIDGWDQFYTITGAALSISGNLTYDNDNMNGVWPVTMACQVNVAGQLIGTNIGPNSGRGDIPAPYGSIFSSPLDFTANGNTIGGGIDAFWESFSFTGNNNTFNGGITLSGYNSYGWRNVAEFSAGYLSIAGTGNTFGAGAINLDCYGTLELVTPQDLSNITAINFNGGNLRLDAPMTALPSGMTAWNVTSGQLILGSAGDSVLGSSGLSVNLGGANSFGTIVGCWAYGTSDPGISRAIVLNGNGGVLDADWQDFQSGGPFMNVSGLISGSGMLIQTGIGSVTFNGSVPNTYSGGTVVLDGRLFVEAGSSLGTGNVTVAGGNLFLYDAGNVAPGATVLVEMGAGAGT